MFALTVRKIWVIKRKIGENMTNREIVGQWDGRKEKANMAEYNKHKTIVIGHKTRIQIQSVLQSAMRI